MVCLDMRSKATKRDNMVNRQTLPNACLCFTTYAAGIGIALSGLLALAMPGGTTAQNAPALVVPMFLWIVVVVLPQPLRYRLTRCVRQQFALLGRSSLFGPKQSGASAGARIPYVSATPLDRVCRAAESTDLRYLIGTASPRAKAGGGAGLIDRKGLTATLACLIYLPASAQKKALASTIGLCGFFRVTSKVFTALGARLDHCHRFIITRLVSQW